MRQKQPKTKAIIGALATAILLALIVLIMTAPTGAVINEQPATAVSQPASYIPNPVMTSNVTWSSFNSGWNPLEYSNGSANLTLNAGLSTTTANPISVNAADIQANGTLQNNPFGKMPTSWSNTSAWYVPSGTGDYSLSSSNNQILIKDNTSAAAVDEVAPQLIPGVTEYPSNNLQFDYITAIIGLSGPNITGVNAYIYIWNNTGPGEQFSQTLYPGETTYISESLAYFQSGHNYAATFNTSGTGYSDRLLLTPTLNIPKSTTSATYTLTIYGLAFTTYPMTLGQNSTGAIINQAVNNANLAVFQPSFKWQSVTDGGYSADVSQTLQNTTESQSSISSGSYIEQATYQGIFNLPSAPDLTYSGTQIQMNVTVSGSQFEVANLNGASYLSSLRTKDNGTFVFGTVNPQNQNSLILEVEYTAAQWNASTNAPSFFSIQGIEYYWWVGVIGLLSIVGLGAAASSHFSGEEENLKMPKGKFGR